MTLKEFYDYAHANPTQGLRPARKSGFICDLCGNGTGADGTGISVIPKSNGKLHCFKCSFTGDRIGYEAQMANLDPQTFEAAKLTAETVYGITIDDTRKDFATYIRDCQRRLYSQEGEPARKYLTERGFTPESWKRFGFGYDPQCFHKPLGKVMPSIIIPYSNYYYTSRPIDLPSDAKKKYDKPKTAEAGEEPLFNHAALSTASAAAIFITEGQFDACAAMQAAPNATACAIGGTGHAKLAAAFSHQLPAKPLILAFDNDATGRNTTERVSAALDAEGIAYTVYAHARAYKDLNEHLQADPEGFADAVQNAVEEAVQAAERAAERERDRFKRTGQGMVDAFLEAVTTDRYKPIPTGVKALDEAIGGGLMRQQLVIIGAAPGTGKTALVQWLTEGMRTEAVYINLEMSAEQLIARSIARITSAGGHGISPTTILRGYEWQGTPQEQTIRNAVNYYREKIAPFVLYNPATVSAELGSIMDYANKEAGRAEAEGRKAPMLVLDYIHLVSAGDAEAATAVKKTVEALKRYAVEHDTLAIAVSANSRTAYKNATPTMSSGRDSSAIEYQADLQIDLIPTRAIKRGGQPARSFDELTADERALLTLCVTKARWGRVGAQIDLLFEGQYAAFTDSRSAIANYQRKLDNQTPLDFARG